MFRQPPPRCPRGRRAGRTSLLQGHLPRHRLNGYLAQSVPSLFLAGSFQTCLNREALKGMLPWRTRYPLSQVIVPMKPVPTHPRPRCDNIIYIYIYIMYVLIAVCVYIYIYIYMTEVWKDVVGFVVPTYALVVTNMILTALEPHSLSLSIYIYV